MSAQQAVYGLQIADPRHAALVKKVVTLAFITAALQIVYGGYNMTQGQPIWQCGMTVLLGLLVPLCGYFGAKNNNSNLMCMFCGCSCFGAFCAVFGIVAMAAGYFGLQALSGHIQKLSCDDPNAGIDPHSCQAIAQQGQCSHDAVTSAILCCECVKTVLKETPTLLAIAACLSIPSGLLSTCAFVFGKQLHDELKLGRVIVAAPGAGLTTTMMAQPQRVQP